MLSTKKVLAFLMCGIALLSGRSASAQFEFIDSETIVNYPINIAVRVGYNNPDPFTVRFVEGSALARTLSVWHQSTVYVEGGTVGIAISARDSSKVFMTGGESGSLCFTTGNGSFTLSGGLLKSGFQGFGNGTFTMRGGTVQQAVFMTENSTCNYYSGKVLYGNTNDPGVIQVYDTTTTNVYGPARYIYAFGSADPNVIPPLINVYGTQLVADTTDPNATYVNISGFTPYGEPYNLLIVRYDSASIVLHEIELRTISGQITLQNAVNPVQAVTCVLTPTDGTPSLTRTVTLNQDGSFTLSNIPANKYDVSIKGSKWLAKVVSVDGTNGDVTGINATLLAGDANNDNFVDVFDLEALITAFDATPEASDWNDGVADFNCDNSVDVLDLDLLIQNFDKEGDA